VLRKAASGLFELKDDWRQTGKVDFSLHDCIMSALAMMFFQVLSIPDFQRRRHDHMQCNNLEAMFGINKLPGDSALRKTLDAVPTDTLNPIFSWWAKPAITKPCFNGSMTSTPWGKPAAWS
jgi:hypothetical protein